LLGFRQSGGVASQRHLLALSQQFRNQRMLDFATLVWGGAGERLDDITCDMV